MNTRPSSVLALILKAAENNGVTVADVLSGWRTPACVQARYEVAMRLRKRGWSHTRIGKYLNMHHTSVMYLCGKRAEKKSILNPESLTIPDESGVWAI